MSLDGYQGLTVAVTGASGFIGSRLMRALTALDCRVVPVSRAWADAAHADVIFHLAAQTSVAVAAADPDTDRAANVEPLRRILAACRGSRRPFIVFAGTVTQAGIARELPANEDAVDDPVTDYDRHKLIAEQELERASSTGAARGTTLRLSNVYGPGGTEAPPDRQVLNRMIRAALRGEDLCVYGTEAYVRDYIFIDDVIDAFLRAGLGGDLLNGRHFIVGSGRGVAVGDAVALVADRVEARTGRRVRVAQDRDRPLTPLDRRHFVADPRRFMAATGWTPSCDLMTGIDRTIEAVLCE